MAPVPIDPVQLFRSLGPPARQSIVVDLTPGERTVTDLAAAVGSSWMPARDTLRLWGSE